MEINRVEYEKYQLDMVDAVNTMNRISQLLKERSKVGLINIHMTDAGSIFLSYENNRGLQRVWIRELEDEWFICNFPSIGHYKCDQLEGVVKLLVDLNIIKNN